MNFDAIDTADDAYMVRVGTAAALIAALMSDGQTRTAAEISRSLPEKHRGCEFWSALKSLKIDGKVDYDEYAAAPTRVHARSMRRMMPRTKNPYNRTR